MNGLLIALVSIGFGGLSWGMLAASDWLLRDEDERVPGRAAAQSRFTQTKRFGETFSIQVRSH